MNKKFEVRISYQATYTGCIEVEALDEVQARAEAYLLAFDSDAVSFESAGYLGGAQLDVKEIKP